MSSIPHWMATQPPSTAAVPAPRCEYSHTRRRSSTLPRWSNLCGRSHAATGWHSVRIMTKMPICVWRTAKCAAPRTVTMVMPMHMPTKASTTPVACSARWRTNHHAWSPVVGSLCLKSAAIMAPTGSTTPNAASMKNTCAMTRSKSMLSPTRRATKSTRIVPRAACCVSSLSTPYAHTHTVGPSREMERWSSCVASKARSHTSVVASPVCSTYVLAPSIECTCACRPSTDCSTMRYSDTTAEASPPAAVGGCPKMTSLPTMRPTKENPNASHARRASVRCIVTLSASIVHAARRLASSCTHVRSE
mmetsp:Transcript_21567/g.75806  ORF Transcript_21567/g.75806 Transcript_21567/m.75806 type:complete len:305 (-) Transcript_21567:396-1310(-)